MRFIIFSKLYRTKLKRIWYICIAVKTLSPLLSNHKISSFPNTNDASIFAFTEFIERYQEKDLDAWITQLSMLKSMAMKKKKKIKKMYGDKFRERLLKEKKRYKKKKSLMKRKHELLTRQKYLNDAGDESFTMGEWKTMHPEFL